MEKRISKLDRLTALLKVDAPPPPTTMTQAQSDKLTAMLFKARIGAAYVGFHTWKNPLYLLEGFVTAHRAGMPMPDWILDALTPAFEKVLQSGGRDKKVTPDVALGFTGKNGKRKPWTERTQRLSDARLKWLFDQQLKKGLPLVNDNKHKVGQPDAVGEVARILGLDSDKRDSLRQTWQKRLKHHNSRLSR